MIYQERRNQSAAIRFCRGQSNRDHLLRQGGCDRQAFLTERSMRAGGGTRSAAQSRRLCWRPRR
jgi:hypothetical protein